MVLMSSAGRLYIVKIYYSLQSFLSKKEKEGYSACTVTRFESLGPEMNRQTLLRKLLALVAAINALSVIDFPMGGMDNDLRFRRRVRPWKSDRIRDEIFSCHLSPY